MSDDIYLNGKYQAVMGTGIVAIMWKTIHKIMERPYRKKQFNKIIELGAGSGEHLSEVKSGYGTYYATDLRIEPLKRLLTKQDVIIAEVDISKIPYEENVFDRTIVSCVLAHVTDPIAALSELHRITKPSGYITIYLPCEPGVFLRIMRSITTAPKHKRAGIEDPYLNHFQEHRNYYLSLNHYLKCEFKNENIQSRYYPFPFLSWNFNLFKIYQIKLSSSL